MDRIIITCKQCGRPLAALPTKKSRKCSVCGATTKILAFQREQAVPISETAERIATKAKKPQLDPGKTTVVKRRAARVLDALGIPYVKKAIDLDPEAETDALMLKITKVPAVEIGGRALRVAVDQLAAALTSSLP